MTNDNYGMFHRELETMPVVTVFLSFVSLTCVVNKIHLSEGLNRCLRGMVGYGMAIPGSPRSAFYCCLTQLTILREAFLCVSTLFCTR